MTHYLLGQLADQRHTQLAARAEREQRTSATRPAPTTSRRTAATRPLSALAALMGLA